MTYDAATKQAVLTLQLRATIQESIQAMLEPTILELQLREVDGTSSVCFGTVLLGHSCCAYPKFVWNLEMVMTGVATVVIVDWAKRYTVHNVYLTNLDKNVI